MQKVARWSRGINCEHMQALLRGVAGGQMCRFAAGTVQIQHGLCGQFGREDGLRRGQAISGRESTDI